MLRVTVDDMFKFDKQTANIRGKVSQQVAVLKRMRNILPFDKRKNIYMSFLVPHFDYCAQTWHFCNKSLTEKLEKVSKGAVRFVLRDKHTTRKRNPWHSVPASMTSRLASVTFKMASKVFIEETDKYFDFITEILFDFLDLEILRFLLS